MRVLILCLLLTSCIVIQEAPKQVVIQQPEPTPAASEPVESPPVETTPDPVVLQPEPEPEPEVKVNTYFENVLQETEEMVAKGYTYKHDDATFYIRDNLVRIDLATFVETPFELPNNTVLTLPVDTVYLDRNAKTARGTCERRLWKEAFRDVPKAFGETCDQYPDKVIALEFDRYNPVTPRTWLQTYAHTEPIVQSEAFSLKGHDVRLATVKQDDQDLLFYMHAFHKIPTRVQTRKHGSQDQNEDYVDIGQGVGGVKLTR